MNSTIRTRATGLLGAVVLGAVAVLGAAVPANAVNIDTTAPVSLTIHKHQKTTTNGQQAGSGDLLTPAPGPGINGVTFDVQRVGNIDLRTDAGWNTVEAIQAALTANGNNIPAALQTTNQTLGTALPVTTAQVAGQDGVAVFSSALRTMYLITETAAPSSVTEKAAPFLVTVPQAKPGSTGSAPQWIYDVHVYPKNSFSALTKTFVAPLTDELAAGRDLVRYNIVAEVPVFTGSTTAFTDFAISDTVVTTNQQFVTTAIANVAASSVKLTNAAGNNVPLTQGTSGDYTLTLFNNNSEYRAVFTANGLTKLKDNVGGKVTFNVLTRVIDVPTDGKIVNNAGSKINNVVNGKYDNSTPVTPITATRDYADLQVFSHVNGANAALAGAVYQLVDKDTGQPIIVNGQPVTSVVTPGGGSIVFENIPVGDYNVKIVTSPAGYNVVGDDLKSVTVGAGSPVVGADPKLAGPNYLPVPFTQTPAWVLPLTGGDGGVLFTVGGGALVAFALGAAFIVARRKRATTDEVETAQV